MDLSAYNEFAVWDALTGTAANAAGVATGGFTSSANWLLVSDGTTPATFDPQNGAATTAGRLGKVATAPTGGGYFGSEVIYTAKFCHYFFPRKKY